MRRCKTPRHIVDPGPAPGRDPAPMAIAVGRPVTGGRRRKPHRAVARGGLPAAVAVERLIAGDVGREGVRRLAIRRGGVRPGGIRWAPPRDKIVAGRAVGRGHDRVVGPRTAAREGGRSGDQHSRRTGGDRGVECGVTGGVTGGVDRGVACGAGSLADKAGAAIEDSDPGGGALVARGDVIVARGQQPHPAARNVDFEAARRVNPRNARPMDQGAGRPGGKSNPDPALAQHDLGCVGIEPRQVEFARSGERDRLGADAQDGAALRRCPHRHGRSDRVVDPRIGPLAPAGRTATVPSTMATRPTRDSGGSSAEAGEAARIPNRMKQRIKVRGQIIE